MPSQRWLSIVPAGLAVVILVAPQALLAASNPYGTGDIAGLSRRARLDRGLLGVVGVTVATARQAVGLLHGAHASAPGRSRASHRVTAPRGACRSLQARGR